MARLAEWRHLMDLTAMAWPALADCPRRTPVVFPIAAMEQHGHHLPLYTDSFLLGEIVRRARIELDDRVIFGPLLWLGNSDHHLDFPGTISATPRTYLDLLGGLADNFVRHGFQRLVFINGHGGNDVPGRQAVFELRQRYRERNDLLFLFGTYWNLAGPVPSSEGVSFHQREMGHACEWETSMMLRLAPELVGDYKAALPVEPGNPFTPGVRGWITRERTGPGHIGWPHLAGAEKGERLFSHFAGGLIEFLNRVVQWNGQSWNG